MKKLKSYVAYVADGDSVLTVHMPGTSIKDVRNSVAGTGRVIAIEEDKGRMPSVDKVTEAMEAAGCTKAECDLVARVLYMVVEY